MDEFLDLCRRLAERGTTAFLIDDLQWVDRSSVDLLGHLASALDDLPVLLLVTHEPVDGRRG
ncbi:MAG: hypothetical protein GWO22_05610, partial [Actinobacteria bacterium]|nr:hypothetical protein [Actinomycetota bacterium]